MKDTNSTTTIIVTLAVVALAVLFPPSVVSSCPFIYSFDGNNYVFDAERFYINTSGDVLPCPFLQVSFGNIIEEEFLDIYARMRNAVPFPLKKECPSFHIADKLFTANVENIPSLIPYTNIKKEWDQMYT